jgi:hypothetical protein
MSVLEFLCLVMPGILGAVTPMTCATPDMSPMRLHPSSITAEMLHAVDELPVRYMQGAAIGDIFLSTAVINHDR